MSERIASRRAEQQALIDFLDAASGEPGALVIEGEPGIGKTTLWLDAVSLARDRGFRVLTSRAAAAESVLAYSALADLLRDVDDAIWADLPPPQQRGLEAALLRRRNVRRDAEARAVAAAFLAVINRLAAQGPVMVAVDDLQWLDTSSATTMSYAARRFPVGAALLCTTRIDDPGPRLQLPSPDLVHRIRLQPLTIGELHEVLTLRLGDSVARPILLRVHEIAGGNPFFALELAREIRTATGVGFSLPSSLSELVNSRIGRVGAAAEDALLAMASLPDPTVQMVARATGTEPDHLVELLSEAENHSVVVIDRNRIRFTHPILAHGVYTGAPPTRRREMHRRLAKLVAEPELRARHLALSDATGRPQTLEALDAAAEIARKRGAPAAAAELLELAIGLGGDTPERRIRCANCYFFAGDPQRTCQLLESSITLLAPGDLRAEALSLLAVVRLYDDGFVEAAELLRRALDEVGDRLVLRVPMLVMLAYALFNAGRLDEAVPAADNAVRCAQQLGEPQPLSQALSMRVLMHFLGGDGFDDATMATALELADNQSNALMPLRPHVQNALLLAFTGQLEQARAEMRLIHRRAIQNGEEGELIFVTFHRFLVECWLGNVAEAVLIAEDATELALQLGSELADIATLVVRAWLAVYSGREPDARRYVADALAASQRSGTHRVLHWAITALGFLEVSPGNYQAALDALQPLLSILEAAPNSTEIVSALFLPDAIEAMINLGRLDQAEVLIEIIEGNGRRLDRAWMLAAGARCRAMLLAGRGDINAAMIAAEFAVAEHQRLPMPCERARTQLLLGQIQRRQRRRDAATASLREARETFERLDMTLWAGRVEAELARGVSGRRRAEGLTPAEQRVAELAVSGLNNRDIAAALFIRPKTVEVTLSRVYRKLNIRSRVELYRTFDPSDIPPNE